MHVDLLVFGPHPDDLEIGMGGTIALEVLGGRRVGLCDLTRGERGSNGTPDERVHEADAASRVLGAAWRVNLGLPDGALATDDRQVRAVADLLRSARPLVVAIPFGHDRHPDHVAAHALLTRAVFDAGLRSYPASGEPWRPTRVFSYFINDWDHPDVVIDVSATYDRKRAALDCHRTQFAPASGSGVQTRLTSPLFRQLIESRDAQFGAQAGVRYAEGFITRDPLLLTGILTAAGVEPRRAQTPA
jgi:bacillithiol biosynthesis deacetylase BshB1